MTRRSPSLAVVTTLGVVLAGLAGMSEAAAQFDVFFGSPAQQRARTRRRPPPAPRRLPVAPRPSGLQPAPTFPLYTPPPEVPLPPPRPPFPDDAPPPAAAEPVPTAGPPKPPAEMQKPAESETPAELQKPVAPEKPPEPAKPQLPARPAPDTAPEAPKAPGKQPPLVVQPVPDELPPKGPGTRPPSKPIAPTPKEPAPKEPISKDTPQETAPATAPPKTEPPTSEPAGPVGTPPPANPPLPPPKPPELVKPGAPGVAPSGARLGEIPRQPEDDAACVDRLKAHNVTAEATTIGPQPDERCTVVRPVRLIGLSLPDGGKIDFPEHPTIACTTAETFSTYVRDLLAPLAKGSLGSPIAAVWTGPGLECRSRDHIFGAKLSAHGQGLAIDIAQLKLADGRKIEVGDPKGETGQNFESAARTAACGYFHTVLGPGSDSYHRTHWHFDLIVRGAQGDSKYCK